MLGDFLMYHAGGRCFFFFLIMLQGQHGLERAHLGFFLSSKQTADPVVQVASGKESTVPATMPQ